MDEPTPNPRLAEAFAYAESRRTSSGRHWHVYFMAAGDAVKIGYAQDLRQRLADVQVGNALDVELIHSIEFDTQQDASKVERYYQRRLIPHRIRGEWFTRRAVDQFIADGLPTLDEVLEALRPTPPLPVELRYEPVRIVPGTLGPSTVGRK